MARPAVFVPGVGGKTVRSRRVTEQWNRKRAARKSGGKTESATGIQRKRTGRGRGREKGREKEEIVIFLCAFNSSSFIPYERQRFIRLCRVRRELTVMCICARGKRGGRR